MKKIVLSIVTLLFTLVAIAQTIESKKEGDYYCLVSPNARYYAGSKQGSSACRYDFDTKKVDYLEPVGENGFKTNMISNDGVVAGAYDWKAALWMENDEVRIKVSADRDEECMHEGRGPCGSRFGLGGHVSAPIAHHTFPVAGCGIVLPQFSATLRLAPWASHSWTVYPQLPRA